MTGPARSTPARRAALPALALFLAAGSASAQVVLALRPASGMGAVSAVFGLERDSPRFGPRSEAGALPAPPAAAVLDPRSACDPYLAIAQRAAALQRVAAPFRFRDETIAVPDAQDVVFFAETRPVRLRLHLRVAGGGLRTEWKERCRKLFAFFDRDGDGYLNAYEVDFIFTNRGVQHMVANGSATPGFMDPQRNFAGLDRDGDGRVSFDEFVAYYNPSAAGLVTLRAGGFNADGYAPVLTDEMFKLLDRDRDGRLSREELDGAESLLATLDTDEDECLSAAELVHDLFSRGAPPRSTLPDLTALRPDAPAGEPLQVYPAGGIPGSTLEQMLSRYDRDKNRRLSKAEIGLDDAAFNRLDRDRDGELSLPELAAWREGPADLEVDLTLGDKPSDRSIAVRPGPDGKPPALAAGLKVIETGRARFCVGSQTVEFDTYSPRSGVPMPAPRAPGIEFVDNGKGYVTEKELTGPQTQYLRVLFDVIDRDGDGKMTRAEFDAYFQLQREFQALPLAVNYSSQVPSLFQLLDTDGDGRLSVRELRNAWSRLRDLEPGGGEYITKAAIQAQGLIRVGRAAQLSAAAQIFPYNPRRNPQTRGPIWFRKMDRNADGEVSRSEFLGSAADFARIDTDHDGRISLAEAEAASK